MKTWEELNNFTEEELQKCSIDNGKCINFILNELDRAKLHLDNISG